MPLRALLIGDQAATYLQRHVQAIYSLLSTSYLLISKNYLKLQRCTLNTFLLYELIIIIKKLLFLLSTTFGSSECMRKSVLLGTFDEINYLKFNDNTNNYHH
jgi:hypothetical protein